MKKYLFTLLILVFTLSAFQCKDIENKVKNKALATVKAKVEKACKDAKNKEECIKKEISKYTNLLK